MSLYEALTNLCSATRTIFHGRIGPSRLGSMSRNVQYVTDANGERTAVNIPLNEYEQLLEDLHVTRAAEEAKDEPTHTLGRGES